MGKMMLVLGVRGKVEVCHGIKTDVMSSDVRCEAPLRCLAGHGKHMEAKQVVVVCFCLFETGLLCVTVLAVLELTL